MNTVDKSPHVGLGSACVVLAVGLAAITLIALAVIVCPPFFATAALAGCAIHLAIGCGAGAVLSAIAGAILLKNKKVLDSGQVKIINISENNLKKYKESALNINEVESEFRKKTSENQGWAQVTYDNFFNEFAKAKINNELKENKDFLKVIKSMKTYIYGVENIDRMKLEEMVESLINLNSLSQE